VTRTPRPNIEVHIDELVLHGFAPADRRGIGDALEAELGRLLAARGLAVPAADVGVARIDAGAVDRGGGGAAIAGAVYGALGQAAGEGPR
jgi:hypothetical protein